VGKKGHTLGQGKKKTPAAMLQRGKGGSVRPGGTKRIALLGVMQGSLLLGKRKGVARHRLVYYEGGGESSAGKSSTTGPGVGDFLLRAVKEERIVALTGEKEGLFEKRN